ncbi:anaerobic sulfite reductase subunit AsrB [Clostridium polynesiense]|uniref:anaerobic sulfite reductase subunit AsrB n=1 Tax=Clostridium polynesiense TaxID=1325933 RepID=UPI00058E29FC|nr:anaerobic sulfite reductase subunit AsrB [Clostridium polynesiense]
MENIYMPFKSEILDIYAHTDIEYNFTLEYKGKCRPGQFFEVSLPKYGEAPISICGINENSVDLTIRRVGVVTDEIHNMQPGDTLFLRGPFGNGFDIENYKNKEVIVAAGGSGLAPVKGIVDYFSQNPSEAVSCTLMAGFKSPKDILFKESLKEWEKNIGLYVTVDGAAEDYEGRVGLITKYIPSLSIKDAENAQVVVVGPPMMMKFTVAEFLKRGIKEENIWVSYERKMCCGAGKCGHCKMNDTYICLDGPVFRYTEAADLVD